VVSEFRRLHLIHKLNKNECYHFLLGILITTKQNTPELDRLLKIDYFRLDILLCSPSESENIKTIFHATKWSDSEPRSTKLKFSRFRCFQTSVTK
jgi:hypothetical protein